MLQRRDYSALVKFLPPKHEYVISVRLSSLQISLYQQYLDNFTSASSLTSDGPGSKFVCPGLFSDYHSLMHIWTHPYVLRLDEIRQEKKVGSLDVQLKANTSQLNTHQNKMLKWRRLKQKSLSRLNVKNSCRICQSGVHCVWKKPVVGRIC